MAEIPYLYLTTTGQRSGRPHEIEIWFVAHNGAYYLVAEKYDRAHWVQNIRHNPAVQFRIAGEQFQGQGRLVDASAEAELVAAVAALMDAKYGWSQGLVVELRADR